MPLKTLVVIVGPTAIGKTKLSVSIAKKINSPILSADSRQFYKELNIGTAKPTTTEMEGVKHYFINSLSITQEYNVGKFETDAINLLDELFKIHSTLILVGGSGLYINAVCKGFDELPVANNEIKKSINELYEKEGIMGFQNLLNKLDVDYYNQVDLQNKQRISRALEVCLTTGKPYSAYRKGNPKKRNFNIIKIGLNTSRNLLYEKINNRVDKMIENNLLAEAKSMFTNKQMNALQTVGYKELFEHIEKKLTLEQAVEEIKKNTRRFAKRQLTWFKKDEEINWFESNEENKIMEFLADKIKI